MEIIGIGSEITECLRVARLIERHGEQFIDRVYTEDEVRYCQSRKQTVQHFTACWAAKEAVLRALGTDWVRGISWRDIEIRQGPNGGRSVVLRSAVKRLAQRRRVADVLVTLSFCRTHATAFALAVAEEGQPAGPPEIKD